MNVPSQTTEQATSTKNGICKQQASFPAKDIAQFAIQRLKRRQREKVRSCNPAGKIQSLEIAANLPVTGHDDCLVRR